MVEKLSNRTSKSRQTAGKPASKLAFMIITLLHDNPLLPIFRDPYKLLRTAGPKRGQRVLEVGCGPGFFTISAANIVGNQGIVYAVDVHPLAIERVQRKIRNKGIRNVRPMLTNASATGFADQSIDLAFIFGLPRIVGSREKLISELRRVLKPSGIVSYKKSRVTETRLIEDVESGGFAYAGKQGKVLLFRKGERQARAATADRKVQT
jgi:precorrin-6B methylase 2